MIRFDEEQQPLPVPWTIATAIPPVRPQIVLQELDYQSLRAALKTNLKANQASTTGISDPTLALADAWAVVGDILGFYQERIVNESYVGTAREPGSVFQLARMIGYAPDQGLAATCYVYYTIDESISRDVRIPAGSKIRAMPQPGEEPQTFETGKDLIARSSWNVIRPATTRSADVDLGTSKIYLAGTNGALKPNDLLLAIDRRTHPEGREIYFLVRAVAFDRQTDQTIVDVALHYPPSAGSVPGRKSDDGKGGSEATYAASVAEELDARNRDPLTTSAYYQSQMEDQGWIEDNVRSASTRKRADSKLPDVEVIGFRKRAMVFGHNAPQRPDPGRSDQAWTIDQADKIPDVIDLEGHLPGVLPKSTLCIETPNRSALCGDLETFQVRTVELTSRSAYGMTGDITRLTLDRPWKADRWKDTFTERYEEVVQRVTVHVDDVSLRLGMMPIAALVSTHADGDKTAKPSDKNSATEVSGNAVIQGDVIELDGLYFGLEPGRRVILEGKPPPDLAPEKTQEPEVLTILRVSQPPFPSDNPAAKKTGVEPADPPPRVDKQARPPRTILTFAERLRYKYDPATVKIFGNVVEASHGETYREVLGSGDAAREHQAFALTRKPVTQLPIPTFPGAEPQISVLVGGEEWRQVATLASADPDQRIFSLWTDETSTARVIFGSGSIGARLPTGRENVVAQYRVGLGRAGNIKGEGLKLAVDHPLGVKEVSNTRAGGGSDPEPLGRVRANTPLSTVALDRLVSEGDYLSFARTYPGIAKAKAFRKTTPTGDIMVISILNDPITPPAADDPLCKALWAAMAARGDGAPALFVTPGLLCPLCISATVKIEPDKSWDDVASAIRDALIQVFGFEGRELGQAAHASEVLAVIQSVDNVEFADVREFRRYQPEAENREPRFSPSIEAAPGGFAENGKLTRAELLLVQPHMPSTIVLEPDQS